MGLAGFMCIFLLEHFSHGQYFNIENSNIYLSNELVTVGCGLY